MDQTRCCTSYCTVALGKKKKKKKKDSELELVKNLTAEFPSMCTSPSIRKAYNNDYVGWMMEAIMIQIIKTVKQYCRIAADSRATTLLDKCFAAS